MENRLRHRGEGLGAFPKLRPLSAQNRLVAPSRDPVAANDRRVIVVHFGDPDSSGFNAGISGGGFGKLATEEEADADAAARVNFLKALVMKKRLYFAILSACERLENDTPDGRGALKLAAVKDLEELADLVEEYEERGASIEDCEMQAAKLETMLAGMVTCGGVDECAGGAWQTLFDDAAEAEECVAAKVTECRTRLTVYAADLLKSLPYR